MDALDRELIVLRQKVKKQLRDACRGKSLSELITLAWWSAKFGDMKLSNATLRAIKRDYKALVVIDGENVSLWDKRDSSGAKCDSGGVWESHQLIVGGKVE